jgi:hypothetical protein
MELPETRKVMENKDKAVDRLVGALKERAKELSCLYQIEELFSMPDASFDDVCSGIVRVIPAGWQYPDVCVARIVVGHSTFESPGFRETPWLQRAEVLVQDEAVGQISVYYTEERPQADEGPFLKEERKLINTIADRLERRMLHERLRTIFERQKKGRKQEGEWWVIVDLLRRTDPQLFTRICRKMLNYLSWTGIEEADRFLEQFGPASKSELFQETNRPSSTTTGDDLVARSDEIFRFISTHLSEKEILASIQKWVKEDRSGFLVKILENPVSSLPDIASAIERFQHLAPKGLELSPPREKGFRVSLIRRLLSDDPRFINVAKQFVDMNDFYELLHRTIFPTASHGKLGGKSAGLFLASRILQKHSQENELIRSIKTPKTWYLVSDGILNFINYNDLEEIVEEKYEDVAQVRLEYPYIVHVFKNSNLPPEIINGLSVALDDFGETPLIVRSSSLLEDREGTAFAGKYKSLFIANQGTKRERLTALMDAVAEVYASTFGPDPIEYRIERGLIDFHEEMGILIQEVVGTKVGHYHIPAFAGVAFSNNEFRWSRRIRRDDGLIRMVPGLGTRAVDRLADDYPLLISPGQPSLRVNVTLDEQVRYSPKKIDVINLKTNGFETVELRDLLRDFGEEYPSVKQLVSILREDRFEQPTGLGIDFKRDHLIATFEGLIARTPFIEQMKTILRVLQDELKSPVDIEFAHDGTNLFLLQCRPQSYSQSAQPATIPRDLPRDKIVFTANRYVSNATVSDITHIVYVDPWKYSELASHSEVLAVGRAISKLNQILPKRRFVLMGPGRWGSRGDIKLGVSVSYSDINNTAMLIEIARKHKDYVPEPSFGTHFFQDLVEASIRYLPLYPDDANIIFNDAFFSTSENMLASLAPEFAHLGDTIRLIDVPRATCGQVLQVLMNGELDEALGMLTEALPQTMPLTSKQQEPEVTERKDEGHWRWRLRSVERLAAQLDPRRFGVKALYVIGSAKNATASPHSDIDLLVHFQGTDAQMKELLTWLEGWSLCLDQVNFLRTGHKSGGLLDIHIVTDEDIRNRTGYAMKIGATTDPARPLPLGSEVK